MEFDKKRKWQVVCAHSGMFGSFETKADAMRAAKERFKSTQRQAAVYRLEAIVHAPPPKVEYVK